MNEKPAGDLLIYQTEDGRAQIECRLVDETIWLSQALMGELFERSKQTISEHLQNLFEEGELDQPSVVRNFRTTAADRKSYDVAHYNLEAILAVGFRVKSPRGTQFRRWANTQLREYIIKGFVMNDERLKNPSGWDYFDELLARIREIRASEKRFYQKVRDLFALSSDYAAREKETQLFFAEVQNKLLYAATRQTAAELIVTRANPNQPNMALTTWSGSRVRKHDIIVAKNYLTEDEVDTLNRLVVIFLEQAELRAKQRQDLSLEYWRNSVDRMLASNDQPLLDGSGTVSHEDMKTIAAERYEDFDAKRRQQEATEADAEDLKAIEDLEKDLKRKGAKHLGGEIKK
ncbi:MAG: hydroxyacid dehydrogenase [Deltaproteobacteria bacterium RIFOXYA12_FULL_61_11]|nr:MAG: hydroxyacid dehydrogenase [Deltaproteobacteria bacterium RIFOXYA12_FULL_61_11]